MQSVYAVHVFVTLEGPEGAGKSSVARGVASRLEAEGLKVLITREPGDGSLGPRVRQILLDGGELDPKAELLLFLADRAQHVAEVVRPALGRGEIVICDRYVDSSLAYQGYGRDLDVDDLRKWNDFATGGLVPDLTLLLDIEPTRGLERVKDKNRLDSEPLAFHQKVRNGFLKEAAREPRRWVILDASQNLENVTHAAFVAVKERRALKL
jgi:dTMP kinase